jgi:hypothetical protein
MLVHKKACVIIMLILGMLLWSKPGVGQIAVLAQAGSGWSEPVMVSTTTVKSWFPDIAVDDRGLAHIVWHSEKRADQDLLDLLMYTTGDSGSYSEPNDIVFPGLGGYTVRPVIADDAQGRLHMAYRDQIEILYTQAPADMAWSASSWTPGRRISGAGTGAAYYADVAVDEQGGIHVVWNESVTAGVGERWLWFGTLKGSALYDGRGWRSRELQMGLGEREVYAIIEDETGVQWFGTSEGVYWFDGGTWKTFTTRDGLVGQQVNCLTQDLDGRLWFGTDRGVSLYDKEERGNEWTAYTVGTGLPDNTVRAIDINSVGEVWVGTEKGVASYDGQRWVSYTAQDGLIADPVSALAVDAWSDVWVGTGQGVSQYDGHRWITYTAENGLSSNVVTAIAIGRQKEAVWVGTDKGLSRFDGQAWTSYTAIGSAVTALMVDSLGVLWVGTETGVIRYDGRAWETLGLPQEFAGQKITAIAEDRHVNALCPLCADVFYRHSTDGGQSWSVPVNLSNSFAGSSKPQIRVGSGGKVYVTWEEGEDWLTHEGYPVGSMYVYSADGGNTWTEPTLFSSPSGAPQQITLGVGQEGSLVVVWRPANEERFSYYYQLSTDDGATWSEPEPVPGVMAKPWETFSLDGYDAVTDSAGNVHLVVLGYFSSVEEPLSVMHLVWNGSTWSPPTRIYASSDPPEWPKIDVGAGNRVYATWFTRDKRHIFDSERGRYKVWASSYQADAPSHLVDAFPTPTPTPILTTDGQAMSTPIATLPPVVVPDSGGLPVGLDTESDEIGWLAVALAPTAAILLLLATLRLGRFRHGG